MTPQQLHDTLARMAPTLPADTHLRGNSIQLTFHRADMSLDTASATLTAALPGWHVTTTLVPSWESSNSRTVAWACARHPAGVMEITTFLNQTHALALEAEHLAALKAAVQQSNSN